MHACTLLVLLLIATVIQFVSDSWSIERRLIKIQLTGRQCTESPGHNKTNFTICCSSAATKNMLSNQQL